MQLDKLMIVTETRDIVSQVMNACEKLDLYCQCYTKLEDAFSALQESSEKLPQAILVDADVAANKLKEYCRQQAMMTPIIRLAPDETIFHPGFYCLNTPVTAAKLRYTLHQALSNHSLHEEVRQLRAVEDDDIFPNMQGQSLPMRRLWSLMKKVVNSPLPVMIQGEHGVGKERVARAIHAASSRRLQPFVKVSCSILTGEHAEAQLFGQTATDAFPAVDGYIQQAAGGTLLLEEIQALTPELQAKLIPLLRDDVVTRAGDNTPVKANLRVMVTAGEQIYQYVQMGTFREDLFYQLNILPLSVPPLRARGKDILFLAKHFLSVGGHEKRLTESAKQFLLSLPWPGNVRQLEAAMYRAKMMTERSSLDKIDFQFLTTDMQVSPVKDTGGQWPSLKQLEQQYMRKVMVHCNGNLSDVARVLDISRSTLYRKISELDGNEVAKEVNE